MYSRISTNWCCLTLLLGLSAAGCGRGEAETAKRAAPRVTVAHPVVRSLTDEDDYTGWLRASAEVELRSRVRGHIQKIYFRDGDMVKPGDLLFELDPRPFQVAIDQSLAQAKVYEAQTSAAEKDVVRYRKLILTNAVAQADLEKVEADAQSYAARVATTMQEVEQRRLDLEYSRITAPIGGRIGKALLTEGNLVNAGGTEPVLTTIVAIDPIYVYFTVDERALQRYRKTRTGESPASLRDMKIPFRFGLDTDEGYPHAGQLDFADNKVLEGTGTIEVRGVADNKRGLFTPGSRVRIRLPVSDPYSATLVPDTAVSSDQKQKYLLLVSEDKNAKRLNVDLGRLLDDGMRVILKPKLQAEAWVIVEGMERARLNYPVEPVPESPPAGAVSPE